MQLEMEQLVSQQHCTAQSSTRQGRLFVLSAPSGAGKETGINTLKQQGMDFYIVPSVTTPAPRPSESEGNPYHFLSQETFYPLFDQGELLEHGKVHRHWNGQPR